MAKDKFDKASLTTHVALDPAANAAWMRKTLKGHGDDIANWITTFLQSDAIGEMQNRNPLAAFSQAADPQSAQANHEQSPGAQGHLAFGHIHYAVPFTHWYRVALDNADGLVPCCKIETDTSTKLPGANSSSVLAPNTPVLVYMAPNDTCGYILGAVPEAVIDGNDTFSDWVVQGSGVGLFRDNYYADYIEKLADAGGVVDWAGGRPMDQLAFDWGRMTELGTGIHVDPFMVFARVDETTGLWLFYQDQLARLSGHQLQVFSGNHECEHRDDEGEVYSYYGEAVYPWEHLGCFAHGSNIKREITDVDVVHNDPYAKFETLINSGADELQAFHRWQVYGGYLGQGYSETLVIPPYGKANSSALNTFQDTEPVTGVYRFQVALNGAITIESAKQVIIAKRCLIPVPKRLRPCDDYSSNCDSVENGNYRYSGFFGDAAKHKVGDLQTQDAKPNLLKTVAVLDVHAYACNWQNLHPFEYHEKDFDLPEESELPAETNQELPYFGSLASSMWLPIPSHKDLTVDHRYGDVKYFHAYSHVTLLDDGGVVIQGGLGEEIRFCGGNIMMSCPGNIMMLPGKQFITLAGDDIALRANNSVDVTANKHDVRIKSQGNMQLLAGNGGQSPVSGGATGGVLLLENRSQEIIHEYPDEGGEAINGSGVIIKSPHTEFAVMCKDIYLRTGGSGIDPGQITLDANRGASGGEINLIGDRINRFIGTAASDGFGFPSFSKINYYSANETLLSASDVKINNPLYVNASIVAQQNMYAVRGTYYNAFGGHLEVIDGASASQYGAILSGISLSTGVAQAVHYEHYARDVMMRFYQKGKIGSESTQRDVSTSMRSTRQYGTSDFELPQAHWQVLNNANKDGEPWAEADVMYRGSKPTQPWPGRQKWTESNTLLTLPPNQFKMYNVAEGVAKQRKESCESRQLGTFQKVKPSAGYYIIPASE